MPGPAQDAPLATSDASRPRESLDGAPGSGECGDATSVAAGLRGASAAVLAAETTEIVDLASGARVRGGRQPWGLAIPAAAPAQPVTRAHDASASSTSSRAACAAARGVW